MRRLSGLSGLGVMLLAACGGVEEMDPDVGPDGGQGDTTAPAVVSMLPEDGATGVAADATVVIEFTEPMDQLSVQNSLDTSELGAVQFAWSDGGAVLTITPDEELPYAAGDDPDALEALDFAVTLGTAATDEAGNAIEAGDQTIFSTYRAISITLEDEDALTAAMDPGALYGEGNTSIYMGDDGNGGTAKGIRGFTTFDLSAIPPEAEGIESATFKAFQGGANGLVFDELGNLLMEHATFDVETDDWSTATEAEINAAFNLTPLSSAGILMTSMEDINVEVDVSSYLQSDLDNRDARGDRSQYRFRLETDLNLDDGLDGVRLHRDFLEIDVAYLIP